MYTFVPAMMHFANMSSSHPSQGVQGPRLRHYIATQFQQILSTKTTDEIEVRLLEAEDPETERFILAFRERWLNNLKQDERKGLFGTILPISRDNYNREVMEASKVDD